MVQVQVRQQHRVRCPTRLPGRGAGRVCAVRRHGGVAAGRRRSARHRCRRRRSSGRPTSRRWTPGKRRADPRRGYRPWRARSATVSRWRLWRPPTRRNGDEHVSTTETLVFLLVIGSRFFVPLLIPKFPLPTIIACLVLDAADQSIFQRMGYDPPGYQSYDKAMDVWYLAMAWLSTLRNWSSLAAFTVSRFLYFYRLVGVVAFELTGVRALLLVFPNTFEYFFIAYEAIRSRWRTVRWQLKWWIGVAAFIWIFIKLPQEWWIHVAQLDFTDALANNPWFGPLIVVVALAAGGAFWIWGRPRLLPADHAVPVRRGPAPAGDGHGGQADPRVRRAGLGPVDGDAGEGGAPRPAVGHLLPDPSRGQVVQRRAVHRGRGGGRDQRRRDAGAVPAPGERGVDRARVRRPDGGQHRPGRARLRGCCRSAGTARSTCSPRCTS